MRAFRLVVVVASFMLAVFCTNRSARAADITFAYDAPAIPTGIVGYEMGCGPGPGSYTVIRDAKLSLTFVWLGMAPAVDTFCNVRAYDINGVRSAWNGEVKVHPPVATPQNLRVTTIVALDGVEIMRVVKNITINK